MDILYVSQYFPPEIGAPAARVSELSRAWSEQGHRIHVLTGFPNHPTGEIHPDFKKRFRRLTSRERFGQVDVTRTWLWPLPNRKPLERILNYTSFCLSAFIRGLFVRRPQVVIGTSPQLLVGVSAWLLARLKRVPFVFEVRDIWPDAILAAGVGREGSLFARTLAAISRFLYRRSDRIVVVSPAFIDELVSRWDVPLDKISLIVNGVDTDLFALTNDRESAQQHLDVQNEFVVSYVGTVGLAHGIGTVLDAARELSSSDPRVMFLIVGEGAERATLDAAAKRSGLTNVRFLGQKPRNEIPEIISASDACLVLLKKSEAYKQVIPTKMLEFMASSRPVVLGVEGQAREILDSANGGIPIEPESVQELVEAIQKLQSAPELGAELGNNGRHHILENFSRKKTATDYIDVLKEVVT